jgi:hypothetical protein
MRLRQAGAAVKLLSGRRCSAVAPPLLLQCAKLSVGSAAAALGKYDRCLAAAVTLKAGNVLPGACAQQTRVTMCVVPVHDHMALPLHHPSNPRGCGAAHSVLVALKDYLLRCNPIQIRISYGCRARCRC